jgi:hypothetical protein
MVDSRKIDAYFDNETAFDMPKKSVKQISVLSRWQRFVKLVFPCFAALLLGIMVVLPNIKKILI